MNQELAAEVAQWSGRRRRERLIRGAEAEGAVTFYTSTAPEDIQSLLLAFGMRYPFVRTEMVRDKGVVVRERVMQECRSGTPKADVIELTELNLGKLKAAGRLRPYRSPEAEAYPSDLREDEGYWVAEQKNCLVLAWNSHAIEESLAPRDYDGLLHPRLKGKIALEAHDAFWMATLMRRWGEKKAIDFFSALALQVGSVRTGHQIIAEQIAAGSLVLSPTIHSNNSEWLKQRNLPIDWRPLQPVVVELVGVALPADPPHPHAAMLLIDFILSSEGQKIYRLWKRIPCRPGVEAEPPYMARGFDTVLVDAKAFLQRESEFEKLWHELILEPSAQSVEKDVVHARP